MTRTASAAVLAALIATTLSGCFLLPQPSTSREPAPAADYSLLGEFRQPSGKRLTVFAAEAADAVFVESNTFEVEWPPRSGRMQQFPEIETAAWFGLAEARGKLVKGQLPLLDALEQKRGSATSPVSG